MLNNERKNLELDINTLLKFLSPVSVGLLAAFFSTKFAIRKFKEEKVWDERRGSYKEVIEAFEELLHWAEQTRAIHCCEPIIGRDANFDGALRMISKFASTGDLLFSDEFSAIVKETNIQIAQLRFSIDDESQPDMDDERAISEWNFILSNKIRPIVEERLPMLIDVAKSEIPTIVKQKRK